jgi:signal transduction histidine kinase
MTREDDLVTRLRAENAQLDEQLKVLVRTEQRLFGSQRALDRELLHVRALADLAVASTPHDTIDVVVRRAMALLASLFRVDRVVVVARDASADEVEVWLGEGAPARVVAPDALLAWLSEPPGRVVWPTSGAPSERLSALFALVEGLGEHATPDPTASLAALVAPGDEGAVGLFAWRSTHMRSLFLAESLSPAHELYLQLVADYLRRAVGSARLAAALERRRRELAEANERLTASLASLREAQEALLVAHKMEAVGRLAGAVAHDFNNMLAVMLGAATIALRQVAPGDPIRTELETIRDSAQRSVGLTRQLLAVARKQAATPKLVELAAALGDRHNLVARLLGDAVELSIAPPSGPSPVEVDPTQLDQILSNLAVNARDAGARRVTVRTCARRFADSEALRATGARPGDYVELAFSDDGCGMDAPTLGRAFEPFFTTKAEGRGTGLGLATVYGIVKQGGGFLDVESAPGVGTTFRVYLPRASRP